MHWVCKWWWVFSSRFLWGLLIQALMKPKVIVIHFEGFSLPLQIRFIPEQHVIQIFSTDGANSRSMKGCETGTQGRVLTSYGQKTQTPLVKYRETQPPDFQKQV
jgi:hypothetical protein